MPDDPKVRDARILGFLHGYVYIRDWIRGTFRFSFARIVEVFSVDTCTYQIDTLGIYRGGFFKKNFDRWVEMLRTRDVWCTCVRCLTLCL